MEELEKEMKKTKSTKIDSTDDTFEVHHKKKKIDLKAFESCPTDPTWRYCGGEHAPEPTLRSNLVLARQRVRWACSRVDRATVVWPMPTIPHCYPTFAPPAGAAELKLLLTHIAYRQKEDIQQCAWG